MNVFKADDLVLLTTQKGKKWLVKICNAQYDSHLGTVRMLDAVGKEEGEFLETSKGAKLFLLRPSMEDYIFKMKRQTQIIYPKDLGAIIIYGDILPGITILESGLGAGSLSLALLRVVGDRGRVISVEKRPEFASLAVENIAKFYGFTPKNHHIVVAEIQSVCLNVWVDRIVLDLPEPWGAIGSVTPLLKTGGLLVSLSPNVGQVQLTYRELKNSGYINIHTFELLKRDWMVDTLRARPVDRMIAHTGFITVAKKVNRPAPMPSDL
ncbi:MAG: tRNA (adenine-N1)-methyltransferase [Desulforhabdus sp.]|jgi:tRNA (adenine57-N1/adenine58-N1)-methyltransferase|nr:tRNA (adenine-N1)-methyltransferase [Desulforhabdus sp.]